MNATTKAFEIATAYVGSHNIIQVDVRNQREPYIRVTFEHALEPSVRKEIIEMASPFHVRFVDHPLNRMVTK
jgi:hypothetical protein